MKRLIIAILACLPLLAMAQDNVWEIPDAPQAQAAAKKKTTKVKKTDAPKYLAGAVPEVDGKVVFTLDKDVPGMSADDIYSRVYKVIESIVNESQSKDLQPGSRIAAVNKAEHTIAANMREWLVFYNKPLALDRTEFDYNIIAQASNGHIHVTLERLKYAYEVERGSDGGFVVKAEDWITDKEALNKDKTRLGRICGKFRRKTIDRKDNIFSRITKALTVVPVKQ